MDITENYEYGGWKKCVRIANEEMEAVILTDVGPRIIRFGFIDGINILGENKEQQGKTGGDEWMIYGGHRLWHSPEDIIRTYSPDNGPVNYELDGETLKMVQDVEDKTGIRKEMEITFGKKNNVKILHRLVNKSQWGIEAAPWAITVMAKGGRAIIPQEPYRAGDADLKPARSLVLWPYTRMADSRFIWGNKFIQVGQVPGAEEKQKIGVLNTAGWFAYSLKECLFIKSYKHKPDAKYPDFGANIEVYTDSEVLEMETLGGLGMIPPGGSAEHIEEWHIFREEMKEDEEFLEKKLMPIVKEL
ncbi:MAG: hypothetical protein U9O59_03720 [Actinomycetota bacterium]|nr:hypothetical protein [Actinomycetota bacterium]